MWPVILVGDEFWEKNQYPNETASFQASIFEMMCFDWMGYSSSSSGVQTVSRFTQIDSEQCWIMGDQDEQLYKSSGFSANSFASLFLTPLGCDKFSLLQ